MKSKILSLVLLCFFYGSSFAQYCTISGYTGEEWIYRVQLGSIDNPSGNNGGYGNYTALSTTLAVGSAQTITLTAGYVAFNNPESWEVYIDYNHDGDFTDDGERIGENAGTGTVAINFTVPLTALSGYTRMRVVMHSGNYLYNPCYADYFRGEAEDYTIQITCPAPTGVSASDIFNTAAKVNWAGATSKYKLQYKVAGTSTWTSINNITNNYYPLTGLTPNTKYNYRVQTVCAPGSTSAFSATASFTTTNNYCGVGGITDYGYINNVKLGTINNISGNNSGYRDYTALSTSLGTGNSQTITLTPDRNSHYYWEVYIDYNQDIDFLDADEKVGQGDAYGQVNINFTVPETALTGKTRMRVVMQYSIGYLNNPCTYFFGEAEDYTVNIATCNMPSGLSASSIKANAATVSWLKADGAKKHKLQYKISGTSTWATVSNITDTFYTITGLTPKTLYQYRVQTICAAGVTSTFSTIASFTTANKYCDVGGSTDYGYINTVKLGTINNTSGNNQGYADYTALSTSIGKGAKETISLTPGGGSHYYWEVYIDYNKDMDFADAGEKVGQGNAYGEVNVSFTVPANAPTGKTRMRIVMQYAIGYLNNPCTYFFGEAEDYSVNIATCNVPKGLAASSIKANTATVSWLKAGGAKKYRLQYRTGTNAWTTVNNIADTFYNLASLAIHTGYQYRVASLCGTGLTSAFSAAKSFTTTFNYCAIKGTSKYDWVQTVSLGSISNNSGNDGGYADYTALSTTLAAGSAQTINLAPVSSPYTYYWRVYIDYNQDGDFYDDGELIGAVDGSGTQSIPFSVPATAVNGNTRMRIVMRWGISNNSPCQDVDFQGEAEDYTVNITGGALQATNAVAEANAAKTNSINSLLVAPNPVNTSAASLLLQTARAGTVNIQIVDVSGRVLRRETISNITAGKNNYTLHNLNLPAGTYMIVASQENAIIARTRFIVAR